MVCKNNASLKYILSPSFQYRNNIWPHYSCERVHGTYLSISNSICIFCFHC